MFARCAKRKFSTLSLRSAVENEPFSTAERSERLEIFIFAQCAKRKFSTLSLRSAIENEPFSTAERSERVENFHFRATREYTEAGIKQATVAMRCLGANSPEPGRRAVPE